MKKWKQLVMALAVVTSIGSAAAVPQSVSAITVFKECGAQADSAVCKSKADSASSIIKNVINTALVILGSIAVLMIVIGGIRYTTSNGNSTHVKEAKDTIMYAVIGLVVAMTAFGIVNFVIDRFN
jgi:hypothetical protein